MINVTSYSNSLIWEQTYTVPLLRTGKLRLLRMEGRKDIRKEERKMDRQTSWTLPIFTVQIQLALFPQLQCNVVGDQIYRLAVLKL